jgi:hypothetical protein
MEPSGCNRWQPVANAIVPETVETSEIRCHALRPLDGKEGVDGSSPSEGSVKYPQIDIFGLDWPCRSCRWSLQDDDTF